MHYAVKSKYLPIQQSYSANGFVTQGDVQLH
nr:MAG TPA: hypothetical protein [Caudoviricetes sp.]